MQKALPSPCAAPTDSQRRTPSDYDSHHPRYGTRRHQLIHKALPSPYEASTSSHSSGPQRQTSSDSSYGLHHRNYGTTPRQRRRRTARDEGDATESCEPQFHKEQGYTASSKDEERGKGQEQSPIGICMQQGALEGLNQSSDIFDPAGPDFSNALMEDTTVNPLHQQQPVGTPVSLPKLHPSLPNRPVCVELPPRIISTTIASSLREKPLSTPDSSATFKLTRGLWDTRREMTALQARETDLVASLRHLDAPRHNIESGRAQKLSELEVRLAEVENELQQERYKRLQAERGLDDIKTEKRAPFIVPALFQAFLMVSEMDGQSLKGSC